MLFLLMILGFIAWWPLGLLVLAFIIGTGRMAFAMGCWNHRCNDFGWHDGVEPLAVENGMDARPLAVEDGAAAGQDGSYAQQDGAHR